MGYGVGLADGEVPTVAEGEDERDGVGVLLRDGGAGTSHGPGTRRVVTTLASANAALSMRVGSSDSSASQGITYAATKAAAFSAGEKEPSSRKTKRDAAPFTPVLPE